MAKEVDHIVMLARSQPGVQRDGTIFDSNAYIDGNWTRFDDNHPRKIGGYKLIDGGNQEIIRQIYGYQKLNNTIDLYLGRASSLQVQNITVDGNKGQLADRTPNGFIGDPNNLWSFDIITNIAEGTPNPYIVAVAPPNLNDINNQTSSPIYYGNLNSVAPLVPLIDTASSKAQTTSGGVVATAPFLFNYNDNGFVRWCNKGDILDWTTETASEECITGTKIVQGMRTRGGGIQSLLFWSLDSLIRATYTGNPTEPFFNFDTIDDNISILSSNSVVKFENQFFWIGIGRFYRYNGVVQPLPNSMNRNFFFDNLNFDQRQKVWGEVNDRWDEIWWYFPKGPNQIECNHAIVYNVVGNFWFDTPINRSTGIWQKTSPYPIKADNVADQDNDNNYGLWLHEYEVDMIKGSSIVAIPSSFETNLITLSATNPNFDRQFRTRRIEPDFVQNGSMTVTINNRGYAQGEIVSSDAYYFDPTTEKIDTSSMGRQVSFKFESNTTGGDYQAGKIIVDFEAGDIRPDGRAT